MRANRELMAFEPAPGDIPACSMEVDELMCAKSSSNREGGHGIPQERCSISSGGLPGNVRALQLVEYLGDLLRHDSLFGEEPGVIARIKARNQECFRMSTTDVGVRPLRCY